MDYASRSLLLLGTRNGLQLKKDWLVAVLQHSGLFLILYDSTYTIQGSLGWTGFHLLLSRSTRSQQVSLKSTFPQQTKFVEWAFRGYVDSERLRYVFV